MTCQGCGTVFVPTNQLLAVHAQCTFGVGAKKDGEWYVGGFDTASDYAQGYAREQAQEQARQARWQQQKAFEDATRQAREQWENARRAYQAPPKEEKPNEGLDLDVPRVKQLLMLCHPDKHGNSELATQVTRWLIDCKKKLEDWDDE